METVQRFLEKTFLDRWISISCSIYRLVYVLIAVTKPNCMHCVLANLEVAYA